MVDGTRRSCLPFVAYFCHTFVSTMLIEKLVYWILK